MIKMFEVNIESFSETKGFFLNTHNIIMDLPDNTTISKVYVIDNKTRIRYKLDEH